MKHIAATASAALLALFAVSTVSAQSTSPAATAGTTAPATPQDAGSFVSSSGLIYRSLKEGSGASPAATDTVKVRYRGTFPDGKEFDSSGTSTVEFPLNRVIKCWTEGVQRMKPGGKAQLTCPAAIAYGDRGAPGAIPPNATLLFEVELVSVAGK